LTFVDWLNVNYIPKGKAIAEMFGYYCGKNKSGMFLYRAIQLKRERSVPSLN
jgi:hypothetical protein